MNSFSNHFNQSESFKVIIQESLEKFLQDCLEHISLGFFNGIPIAIPEQIYGINLEEIAVRISEGITVD